MPVLLIIIATSLFQGAYFLDYMLIKVLNMFSFGFVILPLIYLFSFVFSDQETAFKYSGVVIYAFGFFIADSLACIYETKFYTLYTGSVWSKYPLMIYPFVFNYWTLGYAERNQPDEMHRYNFQC